MTDAIAGHPGASHGWMREAIGGTSRNGCILKDLVYKFYENFYCVSN